MKTWEELTEEQKKKLKIEFRKHMKNSAFSGLKICTLLLFANFIIILVDALYVKNQAFALFGGILNAIFILPILSRDSKKERDRLNEEVKKILAE